MMMDVDVRPHNDVKRLFITFAITFLGVHKFVDNILMPPTTPSSSSSPSSPKKASSSTTSSPAENSKNNIKQQVTTVINNNKKNCVETEPNNYYCSDNPEQVQMHKTAHYYLQNFGVLQTIEGNGEENKRMRHVAASMTNYLNRWIGMHQKTNEGLIQQWYVMKV